ncbi:MAG: dephospho-CoA kinase [Terriglobales bacterium]
MLKIGLTGGMATGKSTVADMFRERGAHVVIADHIAHQLMQPGTPVFQQIVARFGRDILDSEGAIDRQRLADKVFSGSPNAAGRKPIEELNAIVHPAVIARQAAWIEEIRRRDPEGLAVVEAALIYEAGADRSFDKMIVVVCDPEQKVWRFAQRMHIDLDTARAEVERRSAAQLSDAEKARRADYVIDNTGSIAQTDEQVEEVIEELKELARQHV